MVSNPTICREIKIISSCFVQRKTGEAGGYGITGKLLCAGIALVFFFLSFGTALGADSLDLDGSIEMALERNLNQKLRETRHRVTRCRENMARANFLPRVSLNASTYNFQWEDNSNSYSMNLYQPIYRGGELTNELKARKEDVKSGQLWLRENEIQLERRVTQAYMSCLRQKKLLKIREQSIQQAEKQLEFVKKEFEAGRRGKEAVLRWEVLVGDYKEDKITLEAALEDACVSFNTLLERNLADPVDLSPYGIESCDFDYNRWREISQALSRDEILIKIFDYTLGHSPAVEMTDVDIKAADYDYKASKSVNAPSIDLGAGYDWYNSNSSEPSNSWNVGVFFRFYLFNPRDKETVRISSCRLEEQKIQQKIFIRDLKAQIHTLYSRKVSSLEQVQMKNGQAEQAAQYLEKIKEKYRAGGATDVDLIDAYRSYYTNQFSRVTALYRYYIERENLEALTGYSDYRKTPTVQEFIQMENRRNYKADTSPEKAAPLFDAINRGDTRSACIMIRKDPSLIKARCYAGWTAIIRAAYRGNSELVEFLLANGADKNDRTFDGITPLYAAAGNGHKEVVEMLVNKGADLEIPGERYCKTPLHKASEKGYAGIAEILLNCGADVNRKSKTGWTALHYAVESNSEEVINLLLERGADVNIKINTGWTPRRFALVEGNSKIAGMLAEKLEFTAKTIKR